MFRSSFGISYDAPQMPANDLERFQFVTTEDGSPTVRILLPDRTLTEPMHSLTGAFSESVYIYGVALDKAAGIKGPRSVISLGLGLGYNEILTAADSVLNSLTQTTMLDSFEIDPYLRASFGRWINNETLADKFQETYDWILSHAAAEYSCDQAAIKKTLSRWLASGALRLLPELTNQTKLDRKYSCYLFDAFSSKTSPDLWDEEFIKSFLTGTSRAEAIFSTYACTGSLKRALQACGFETTIRPGFANKRESTLAEKRSL